jgi:protein-disulfide isomerase
MVVTVAVAALLVGGAIGYAVHGWLAPGLTAGQAVTPPHATEDGAGIVINPDIPASQPRLVVYQDYQCPWCAFFARLFEPTVKPAVSEGRLRVEYRTMTFLDSLNDRDSATARSSTRAAMAAVCADAAGVYGAYHDLVHTNQPAEEGDGFTDALLRDQLPAQAGLSGSALASFQRCYDDQSGLGYVLEANYAAQAAGVTGTPRYVLNGQPVQLDRDDPTTLQRALDAIA